MPRYLAPFAVTAVLAACSQLHPAPAGDAAPPTTVKPTQPVLPRGETEPVASDGDAADDPAIWVDPQDPAQSLIVGTDKQRGLQLYDLQGRQLQALPDGRLNNVDLRDGFRFAGKATVLVAATNRTQRTISFYLLDPVARRLERVGPDLPTGFEDPYGFCLYAARNGAFYAFANEAHTGHIRQWRLREEAGSISAELVRQIAVGSQAEGCAADDETGDLYVAEEDVGLWKYGAEPGAGSRRVGLDRVGEHGLAADLEGVAIWRGRDGRGWIVVSNQGASNYAVYRRDGNHEFIGRFAIVFNSPRDVDGTSDTDGLEIVSPAIGAEYPEGLLVVQDGNNEPRGERQNFKLVSWHDVATALGLPGAR